MYYNKYCCKKNLDINKKWKKKNSKNVFELTEGILQSGRYSQYKDHHSETAVLGDRI